MPKTVKLRKVGDSLVITVPKDIAESLSWSQGDMLEMMVTGPNGINLTKK